MVSMSWIIATFPTKDGVAKCPATRKNASARTELNNVVERNFSAPLNGFTNCKCSGYF